MRAALLLIAVAAAACGGASPAGTPAPTAVPAVDAACVEAFSDLTDALTELDSRLSVGMNFSDYGERVADSRVAYDRIKVSSLSQSCIATIGQPEEDALNAYVRAYNTWNDCIKKTGCKTETVTPALQAEWTKATGLLKTVKSALP